MRHLAIFFKTALILGLFCATPQPARAAESKGIPAKIPNDYYVQTWQDDDGLPRNTLTAISQTPDGYLWLATSFGLIRFDGVRFATFGEEVLPELARSLIWQLQTDRAGRLWIGTGKGGILVFENGTFRRIKSDLPHSTVYSMCEDPSGVMWVSTGDGSISRIVNGKTVELIGPLRGNRSSMAIRLVRDRAGDLWFAQGTSYGRLVNGVATNVVKNSSGLVHLCASHSGGVWLSVNRQLRKIGLATDEPTFRLPFGNYEIQQLFEDRQGNLWIATRNLGLFRFSQNELQPVLPSKNRILDIFQDAEGSLWVATEGGGLSKIRPRVFRMLSSDEGVPPGKVLSVCGDRNGVLWVLPQFGGLAHSSTNGSWEVLSGTTNVGLTSVLPDRNGGVWVGTVSAGLLHYDGQKVERMLSQTPFQDRQLRVLYPGREGQLWVALFPSGLARLDGANITSPTYYRNLGLNEQAIWAMAEEKNGALWTGTINGNLQRLENEKVTSYTEADGLPGTAIGALHLDGAGQLWVGTLGSGLGSLRNGKFKFASVREGLHDNVISQIVEDDYGFVWFGSNRGIFRVRKLDLDRFMSGQQSKVESIAYGKSDGLANVECGGGYQPSVWKTKTGQLCFATSKGAIYFDPAALPLNSRPPPLALERVLVDGQSVSPANAIELDWNHKNLEFDYTALSFIAPEKVHFRRQLVGFDPGWVEAGTARYATYPRLDPGRYEFRFTACNNDGVWNQQPVTLAIVVTPAWWQGAWFRALMVLAFAAVIASLARYFSLLKIRRRLARLEQSHALEKERARIARDIHDDVGARLTQMAYLSDLASTEFSDGAATGGERLKEIARASRQTVHALDEIVWAVNPRKDSLAHLVEYISQYANNFFRGTAIRCRQDLPATLPDWPLPSEFRHHLFLAAKEALNNIQKHSKASEVWIRVAFQSRQLELVIEDNGEGFSMPETSSTRDGLQNMRSRLSTLGGTCHISSQPGVGTRLEMTVALPKLEASEDGA